jgi:hypothetical protein
MAYIPNVVGRKLLRLSVSFVGGVYVPLTKYDGNLVLYTNIAVVLLSFVVDSWLTFQI